MSVLQTLLQQHLPFTVLKLYGIGLSADEFSGWLQQHLPFTVLKPKKKMLDKQIKEMSCNSTYRLRY